jgi:hypothetical protein
MFKMGSHHPFGHLKHKLWPKERPEVKFDSRPLKVDNRPDFLTCRWLATYRWKALNEGYNFASDLISIGGLHIKLCGPKVAGVPTLGISALPFGSPRTKCHLDANPVPKHIVYYKGEGGGFPQFWAVVSLVNSSCPWLVLTPKVLQLNTNQLVIWFCAGLCEWLNFLSFFLVPSRSSNMPLYPQSVASQGVCPQFLTLPLFFISYSHLNLSRSLGAHHLCSSIIQEENEDVQPLSYLYWKVFEM